MIRQRRGNWCRFGWLVLVAALGGPTALRAQEPAAKKPAPDPSALQPALALVQEVYGDEFKRAKDVAQKTALAEKLLQKAKESAADPTSQFALLRVARDVAALAGDADLALRAVDDMTLTFAVEVVPAKVETLLKAAQAARQTKQSAAIVAQAATLIEGAVQQDDFDNARALSQIAIAAARKSGDSAILKNMVARDKELDHTASAYANVKDALAKLKSDAVDPDANLAVGRYYCLVKGDWEKGRPYLALGSDEPLKTLAIKELKSVSGAEEQVAVGDGWWELASASEDAAQEQFQRRAAYWYRQALPALSGLARDKAESRLSQLRADGPPPTKLAPQIEARMKRLAIWTLNQGGKLDVQLQDSHTTLSVEKLSALPQSPFVVTAVSLTGLKHIRDRDVQNLLGAQSLTSLSLKETGITNASLGFVKYFVNLRVLNLAGTKINDAGLAEVGRLSGLETLYLGGTGVSDKGMAYLSGLTKLKYLGLYCVRVTDQGISQLSGVKNLEGINVGGTRVSDEAIRRAWPQCRIERPR